MPKGPQGQKRKADVIGNAVLIGKIATGEVEDKRTSPAAMKVAKAEATSKAPEVVRLRHRAGEQHLPIEVVLLVAGYCPLMGFFRGLV